MASEVCKKTCNLGGMCTIRPLTDDEIAFYRGLRPGVSVMQSMIRSVAVEDDKIYVLEMKADGFNRINLTK